MVKCALGDVESLGHKKIVINSDPGAVMKARRAKIKQLWSGRWSPNTVQSIPERALQQLNGLSAKSAHKQGACC